MADLYLPEKRSEIMSRIRSARNKDTELRMITLFRESGLTGWRRNMTVFGKPDFVFPQQRLALFVDGCFWHRHTGCKFCYTPKSRQEFWLPKFERNTARDRLVNRTLRQGGWKVVRIWECDLSPRRASRALNRLRKALGLK